MVIKEKIWIETEPSVCDTTGRQPDCHQSPACCIYPGVKEWQQNSLSGNNAKEKPKMMKSYFTVAGTSQAGTSLPQLESNKRRFEIGRASCRERV